MKLFLNIIVGLLVLLAIASGLAKVSLAQVEIEFYAAHGFSEMGIILFGAVQLVGAVLLALPKTRIVGAGMIAATFAVSLVLLLQSGNTPVSIVTAVCIGLLGFVAMRSRVNA